MSKKRSNQLPGQFKLTLKFYDEDDNVVYLRVPPKASWFICTSVGTIDPKAVQAMFVQTRASELPEGTRAVYTMPEAGPDTKP
jgi:hypothetical protein